MAEAHKRSASLPKRRSVLKTFKEGSASSQYAASLASVNLSRAFAKKETQFSLLSI
jgi:hypothetical protein